MLIPFWSLSHTFVGYLDTWMLVCQTFNGFIKNQRISHTCKGFWCFLQCHTFKGCFRLCFKVINLWKCDSVKPVKPTLFERFSDKETILPFLVLKPSFLNPQVKVWHVTLLCHSVGGFAASLIKLWQTCHAFISLSKNFSLML